jgi:ATP-dependent RNA helicase DDX31/DBP7
MNLKKLTVVQQKTLAPVLAGKDVLVSSETGSGKTLAYLIPIVNRLVEMSRQSAIQRDMGTLALVLAPTRELCIQIHEVTKKLIQPFASFLVSGLLIGGEKTKSEKARLRKGVNILIATPGRLAYHLQNTESF